MTHRPPPKGPPRGGGPRTPPRAPDRRRSEFQDPSAFDIDGGWGDDGDEEDEEVVAPRRRRDAIRDLDDPTYGFPIGSFSAPPAFSDEEDPTEVDLVVVEPGTPQNRSTMLDTPTMEFAAPRAVSVGAGRRDQKLQSMRRNTGPELRAPVVRATVESAEFEPAEAPVDNSVEDLVDYAEIETAPPVDGRVLALLVFVGVCFVVLVGLIVLASLALS